MKNSWLEVFCRRELCLRSLQDISFLILSHVPFHKHLHCFSYEKALFIKSLCRKSPPNHNVCDEVKFGKVFPQRKQKVQSVKQIKDSFNLYETHFKGALPRQFYCITQQRAFRFTQNFQNARALRLASRNYACTVTPPSSCTSVSNSLFVNELVLIDSFIAVLLRADTSQLKP